MWEIKERENNNKEYNCGKTRETRETRETGEMGERRKRRFKMLG